MRRLLTVLSMSALALFLPALSLSAQVTTASIGGLVTDSHGNPLPAASLAAVHQPSGTTYQAVTRADGRFTIPGMRVGGPYSVTVSHIGFQNSVREEVHLNLGVLTAVEFVMAETAIALEGIVVTAETDAVFSSERTGASTSVDRDLIDRLPTISRRIEDFARLTPQYTGGPFGSSFAGQDNRLNNITVDGAYFNNSFGLSGQPGDRTGVAPISLAAIEQLQVNVAPFDVRQSNFVGAGVNTVTRSGTNDFRGSFYYQLRNDGLHGNKAADSKIEQDFRFRNIGGWASGPIIQNRLFFFASLEAEDETEPGTTWRANRGGEEPGGNITRVLESDLNHLSSFLRDNFGYETGGYQGYDHSTPAARFLVKLDYNVDERNKLSLRYSHLDSDTDVPISLSSSLGWGGRRSNTTGLNFQRSNYQILENIRSVVGEWNSLIGTNMSNNLIVGYTHHDESRGDIGELFPMVDILEASSVYTTFGSEPFTPNNELRYNVFQLQNNFTIHGIRHDLTFGLSAERYRSENVFFPGSQSVYVYNSLDDFLADAQGHLANPNRTSSDVEVRRFQVRWMNQPGMAKPVQPLEVYYTGIYGQDQWRATDNLTLNLGLRLDVPFFRETGFANASADGLTFRDEDGNAVQYSTSNLPGANILWSPRLGFNWDVLGDRTTQLRGGTGIFTGQPAFVWISNQIGNTGVLTGFERLDETFARPFHPDPNHYKPTQVSGTPAESYELALTDPDFKFPQLWRTNLAVDQRLPLSLIGTAEFMYSRDVNGVYYINANLPAAQGTFAGVDNRPRWTGPSCGGADPVSPCVTRLNNGAGNQVENAVVLKNQNVGRSWLVSTSVEKPFGAGSFVKAAYSYGKAKNTIDPGSIAFGSWNNNPHAGDPNNPGLGFSSASPGHRFFLAGLYRNEWFHFGGTGISFFLEGVNAGFANRTTQANASYTFAGDINGDGGTSNDLIYIHRDISEMNFQDCSVVVCDEGRYTFSATDQAAAWEAYIQQDEYLRANRGRYAERGAARLPMVWRADVGISQEFFRDFGGRRNSLELRADILNVGNLLNSSWGVGKAFVSTQPLIVPPGAEGGAVDADGRAQYRLRAVGGQLLGESYQSTAAPEDVYRIQISARYLFN